MHTATSIVGKLDQAMSYQTKTIFISTGTSLVTIYSLSMFADFFVTFIDMYYFAGTLLSIHFVIHIGIGINICLTYIVRIVCLGNLNFMEDIIGEKLLRILVLGISGLSGILAYISLLVSTL
jgi:hypothetical protein